VLQLDNAFLRSLPSGADSAPLALFSALKELHLRGSFDGLAVPLPMLSVFSHCTAPSADALPPLEAHPTLKTFEFGYAAEGAFEGRLADLVTTLPALEHLALEVSLTEAVLDQLLRLPRWKRLKGLSLEHCRVRSADGLQKYVKKHAADFAHSRSSPRRAPRTERCCRRFEECATWCLTVSWRPSSPPGERFGSRTRHAATAARARSFFR
jgi:hypothetical protein